MIQFYCPYCAAPIQVESHAAGKSGRCPRCASKVTVPFPPGKTPPSSGAPPSSVELDVYQPTELESESVPQDLTAGQLPNLSAPTSSASPLARKLRRRGQPGNSWLMPIVFISLFLGVLVWFGRDQLRWESLSGDLPGAELTDLELPVATVSCAGTPLGARELAELLERLEVEPIVLTGDLMQVQIRGQSGGLSISVLPGKSTVWYRVSPQQNADLNSDLNSYLLRESSKLEQERQAELVAARDEFLEVVRRIHAGQSSLQDVVDFRDRLALPGLVNGLGHHLVAQVGQRQYRCVREANDGSLYFLLPAGLPEFQIIGRELPSGQTTVPANFRVVMTASAAHTCEQPIPEAEQVTPMDHEASGEAPQPDDAQQPTPMSMSPEK